MGNRLILGLMIAGLAACTSEARVVACAIRKFRLTKRAPMPRCNVPRAQIASHADETVIETAEPRMSVAVYVWATRTIDERGASTLSLKSTCRGMYRADGHPGRPTFTRTAVLFRPTEA